MADLAPLDFPRKLKRINTPSSHSHRPLTLALARPVLKIINESRSTRGIRHQDYARYKAHCSTKLAHLRKKVGLTQSSTSGSGKTKVKKYTKKDVALSDQITQEHLLILLFSSERDWAYSQHLTSLLSDPSTPHSTLHLSHKRLLRSSQHACTLSSFLSSPSFSSRLSLPHRAQIKIYALLSLGTAHFSRSHHEKAIRELSFSYALLNALAAVERTAKEEARVNECMDDVEQMVRFCAYELGRQDLDKGVEKVVEKVVEEEVDNAPEGWKAIMDELESERNKGREEGGEREDVSIAWRGEEIQVRNVEIVEIVQQVKSALASLGADATVSIKEGKKGKKVMSAKRMGTFDKALLVLNDAEAVASQLVEDNKIASSRGHSARVSASSGPLLLIHSYILYQLLLVRTQRDLLLVSSTLTSLAARESKLNDAEQLYLARTGTKDSSRKNAKVDKQRARVYPGLVKIYDGVVGSLEQMRELVIVERDAELAAVVEARIAAARASRCHYLSLTYSLLSSFPSSLSLLARAKLYSRESRSISSSLSPSDDSSTDLISPFLPLTSAHFDALDAQFQSAEDAVARKWCVAAEGGLKVEEMEQGHEEDTEGEVEEWGVGELTLEEVGQKKEGERGEKRKLPFYDVAFNYVAAIDLDAIARRAGLRGEVEEEVQLEGEKEEEDVEMEERAEEKVKVGGQKKGWFGLFGRG